jgi:hypothetical protein
MFTETVAKLQGSTSTNRFRKANIFKILTECLDEFGNTNQINIEIT